MKHTDPKDGRSFIEAVLEEEPVLSRDVAGALGLQVFQITAKLKSLATRGFLVQGEHKHWSVTKEGKEALASGFITFSTMNVGGGRNTPPTPPTDEDVPVIQAALRKDGWRSRWHGATEILVAPDGTEYVYATAWEKADLIYYNPKKNPGIAPVRWRKIDGSHKVKALHKERKLQERAEKSRKARKQDKARRVRHIKKVS